MDVLVEFEILFKRKIRQYCKSFFATRNIKRLTNTDFVIVSRNCWGGQVYQHLQQPYNTPFVGLFLFGPCYMKLLANFDDYMKLDLDFIMVSKYPESKNNYPIGLLNDVEIHFQHYETEVEAREKWNRRKARMLENTDKDSYFFMVCDRRRINTEDLTSFHELPFKNMVSFAFCDLPEGTVGNHIKFFTSKRNITNKIPNGKKRFKLTFLYFDVVHWLNSGAILRTRFKQ
ncbi:DUF1919 domain-containing protein [Maribacter antarcticus]|uniref:DUF1919 domain-containing protein n=1 Tax=Maribacter antarcticus TaxID=505250 RepID=UPI0006847346|nr:DUF1919 domain-containing protein [Maribacter antarcticus]